MFSPLAARYLSGDERLDAGGEGLPVKRNEEILEILEAFDLTGSYRAAAELAGCDHHTVARYVALRDAGQPPVARG